LSKGWKRSRCRRPNHGRRRPRGCGAPRFPCPLPPPSIALCATEGGAGPCALAALPSAAVAAPRVRLHAWLRAHSVNVPAFGLAQSDSKCFFALTLDGHPPYSAHVPKDGTCRWLR
jgi:hypothetical protein